MTVQGMNNRDLQSYIVINANLVPERIREGERVPTPVDDDAFNNMIYRLHDHSYDLANCMRGRTANGGILIYGTMKQACDIRDALNGGAYQDQPNVVTASFGVLGKNFKNCVNYYTGRAAECTDAISAVFSIGARPAANAPIYEAPKLALAA